MRKLLFILSMILSANLIFAQTATLKIGTLYEPAPGLVNVPITLEAINNPVTGNNLVSGYAFYIKYNSNVLGDAVNFVNWNPLFPAANALTNVVLDTPEPGWNTIAVIYATSLSGSASAGMTFFNLQFTYTSGASNLDWTDLFGFFTNMTDDEGNEFALTLMNGCVCLNQYDVTFHVTDNIGNPLLGAQVTVGTETLATNASGDAVFNRSNGNYSYTVTNSGFYDVSGNFTVAGAPVTVNVIMNPLGSEFDVTFHVTDGINNLENAMVIVGAQTLYTNAAGEAVFSLANGNYNYDVSKFGYSPATGSFIVASASQTINVVLTALPLYDITFHVTSGGNNIEGASFEIPDVETLLTDVNGNAVFSLIDGTYNYTITKTGFAVKTGSITVAGSDFTVEETLIPLYEVNFHATVGGVDLEGVTIMVGAESIITNATGNALFNLPDGNYSYTASKNGYDLETGNFTVAGANLPIEVAMNLIEYDVTFHVTSGGNNLQGVLVTVGTFSATTDANGIAVILLPNGDYEYTATKEGYYEEQDVFQVAGGPVTVEVNMIQIPSYDVTFHVTSGGANLAGADVTIGTQTVTTNANGIAIFSLINGPYSYTATKLGYVTQTGSFDVINVPMTIEVEMPLFEWAITFHVVSGGANLPGATVTVNPGNLTGFTDPNGNATLNIVNGSYTYTVEKANYVTQTGSFVVNNANQTIEVIMPLSPWQVTFHIVSTGGALAGVNVTCNGQTVVTDASGNAVFNLTNGTYDYTAVKDGYITLTGSITVNNAPLIKNLIMFPITVTFVVTNNSQPIQDAEVTLTGFSPLTTPANGTVVFSVVPNGTYAWTVTHPDYGLAEGDVTVNNANVTVPVMLVGVYDFTSSSFNIYPNPSNGTFNITTTAVIGYESDITVFDLTGKLVYTGKLQGNDVNVIDLSAQEKGMYILQIIVEDKVYNKTLVIQ